MESVVPMARPLLGRQRSSPLPPHTTEFMTRQQSAPTPNAHRNASDGGAGRNSAEDAFGSQPTPLAAAPNKRSAFARMRVLGSIRNARFTTDGETRLTEAPPSDGVDEPQMKPEELKMVMDRAIRYFNLNPKVGLKFLKEKRVTYNKRDPPETNARRLALFLKNTKGLNKSKIGLVLSGEALVLREYMSTFDFSSHEPTVLGVETALRELMTYFKPPGEGQQIDRILESFGARFALHCGNNFNQDAVHMLSYLIIMLNVFLHNPRVRSRPLNKKEDWVSAYAKEPTLQRSVSREELSQLYDNIARTELKHELDRDELAGNLFSDPEMSGWLDMKMLSTTAVFPLVQARWKRRWVILSQNVLYYFRTSSDVDFEGFITLENVRLYTEQASTSPGGGKAHVLRSRPSSQNPSTMTAGSLYGSLMSSSRDMESARTLELPPLPHPNQQEDEKGIIRRPPRLARLFSCPGFTTSQSSLNSAETTTVTVSSAPSSTWLSSTKEPLLTFILASADPRFYVKSARLSKRRALKGRSGELISEQCHYVAFRTRLRPDFEIWLRKLRENGIVKGTAAAKFYQSINSKKIWSGNASRFKLRSPGASLPQSFSADLDADVGAPQADESVPLEPIAELQSEAASPLNAITVA